MNSNLVGTAPTLAPSVGTKELRMSTPFRTQLLAMGGKDYFIWHERMEISQR